MTNRRFSGEHGPARPAPAIAGIAFHPCSFDASKGHLGAMEADDARLLGFDTVKRPVFHDHENGMART